MLLLLMEAKPLGVGLLGKREAAQNQGQDQCTQERPTGEIGWWKLPHVDFARICFHRPVLWFFGSLFTQLIAHQQQYAGTLFLDCW